MRADSTTRRPRRALHYPADRFDIERLGGQRSAGAAAYVRAKVAEELIRAARQRSAHQQVALLYGTRHEEAGGLFVEVRAYTELHATPDPFSFAEELHADWRLTSNRVARLFPDMRCLGWVSIRRGSQAIPGPGELFVHRTFFNLADQLLLMLDPVDETWTLHGAGPDGYLRAIGFNLVRRRETGAAGAAPASSR